MQRRRGGLPVGVGMCNANVERCFSRANRGGIQEACEHVIAAGGPSYTERIRPLEGGVDAAQHRGTSTIAGGITA